ncbi:GAT-like protein [Venustampulla echinocandica]|uniref:GAT-like protein n=1 Tax=Venustampulla echinocandica TaxID=2656787 RepID=A0A370U000_9HELO|nr:GAT-like protein [Venustampulla echinocandica]RDL41094.1 GAT-like protein [Venustampulla echinocandica]
MKGMKGMNVNRMLGTLKRRPTSDSQNGAVEPQLDTPEANASRNVRLFCESGGPNGSGEEVLYLPTIVESCESSPSAAKEAAYLIRKFLSKDNYAKPYVQYNAIMLIRILADNPGPTFTRNMDTKFVQVVKELLRAGRDPSVRQILIETLDTFGRKKYGDEGCVQLNEMWKKEREKMTKAQGPISPGVYNSPPLDPQNQNYFSRNHRSRRLPPPQELASRIEEARISAQLLSQTVQSTPPSEILQNELVREFSDRCQSASRSVQAYMVAEDPAPDNDTMETLIETNEQLSKAMHQHQRAALAARKAAGLGNGTPPPRTDSGFAPPPPGPPPTQAERIMPTRTKNVAAPQIPPPGDYAPTGIEPDEDPFADPVDPQENRSTKIPPVPQDKPPRHTGQFNDQLGIEPYHPGFKPSPGYNARQDSSAGQLTMHAAGGATLDEEKEKGLEQEGSSAPAPVKAPVYRY